MGIKALRKLLLGAETTAGTAVAADLRWRGTGVIEDQQHYYILIIGLYLPSV